MKIPNVVCEAFLMKRKTKQFAVFISSNITLVYKKKIFFELFQICNLILNVSRLLN